MANPLQDALAIVQKCRADLKETLSNTKFNHNLLTFNSWLDKIEAKLVFAGATKAMGAGGVKPHREQRFPQMTSMMGRPITGRSTVETSVKKEILTREEQQEQAFLTQVDNLWGKIGKLSPQSVLNNYGREKNAIWILRGVAKKAKIENFATADLTINFVQAIQAAIARAMDETTRQVIIDKSIGKRPVGSFIITEERMAEEPAWASIGAEVGDLVSANNKKFKLIAKANDLLPPEESNDDDQG